jgi:pimeloyl-ACP methyl ester carboxylesterase
MISLQTSTMNVKSVERLTLSANGFRFHALACGPERGPLVMLLHGFPQFADMWMKVMPALGGAGFRAVADDQRHAVQGR